VAFCVGKNSQKSKARWRNDYGKFLAHAVQQLERTRPFVYLSVSETHELVHVRDSRTHTHKRLKNWHLKGAVQRLEQICSDVSCLSVCVWAKFTNSHIWETHELMSCECLCNELNTFFRMSVCLSVYEWGSRPYTYERLTNLHIWETHKLMSCRRCVTNGTNMFKCLFVNLSMSEINELIHVTDTRTDVLQVLCNEWKKYFRMSICLSVYEQYSRTYTCERLTN